MRSNVCQFLCRIMKAGPRTPLWSCFLNWVITPIFPLLHKIRYTTAGLTLSELETILGIEPGDVFRCSFHLISRQVTRPPPQSEMRKRNTLRVVITELQANGNGVHVTRPRLGKNQQCANSFDRDCK